MYRVDGFYGGPVSEDWFMSVGGFYRTSSGIRDPQFPADDGGQITATLSHKFEGGKILFWARELNDKNLFITAVPVGVSADGKTVSNFPGFNALTGTFAGNATRAVNFQEFPGSPPGTIQVDLSKGRGSDLRMFGHDLDLDLGGGWNASNRLGFTSGHMPTNALFNNLAPQTLASFIAGTGQAGTGTYAASGGAVAVDPTTQVASLGVWVVDKSIQSYTDELRFNKDLFEGNTLTVGGYFASYSSDDQWYLGNNLLMTATPNAQLIDVVLANGSQVTRPGTGELGGAFNALSEDWSGRDTSAFVSDTWHFGQWIFDGGYRVERQRLNGSVEGAVSMDLDSNPLHLWNKGVNVANGVWTPETFDHTLGAWSVGVNYELTPHMAVYGRANEGYHFPQFDDIRSGTPQTQQLENFEVGYKAQTETVYAVVDVFERHFFGVPFQQFLSTGQSVTASYGASTQGLDFEGSWTPLEHFTLLLTGDYQRGSYQGFQSAGAGTVTGFNYTGNRLPRQ